MNIFSKKSPLGWAAQHLIRPSPMVVRIRLARFGRRVSTLHCIEQLKQHQCSQVQSCPWPKPPTLTLHLCPLQNLPFYRIFAADSRCPRDGRHLEQLGHFDPVPGILNLARKGAAATALHRKASLVCLVPNHCKAKTRAT